MYFFSGNSAASAPISTFMCLWAIYIAPGSVYIFPPAEKADRSWEYLNHWQTHECGNWTEALIFLFWEYLFRNFGILSLQCTNSTVAACLTNYSSFNRPLILEDGFEWIWDRIIFVDKKMIAQSPVSQRGRISERWKPVLSFFPCPFYRAKKKIKK
jgi:hypothetical protein